MKALEACLLFGLAAAALAASFDAKAESSIEVGGATYYCQNTCIVVVGPNGVPSVSDSRNGWVRVFRASGHLPVPPK